MMPAKRLRLECRYLFTLIAVVFLVPAGVGAQTGGVTLRTTVSETVTLSVAPNFDNVDASVMSSGNTVRITLSTENAENPVIRVPLLVRSNSSFKISATVESTAQLTQFSVADVRATGTLVSPQAVNGVNVSEPLLVITGPRVSLGGTLNSPNNALQITVLIRLQPEPGHGSPIHLTFAATPGSLVQ